MTPEYVVFNLYFLKTYRYENSLCFYLYFLFKFRTLKTELEAPSPSSLYTSSRILCTLSAWLAPPPTTQLYTSDRLGSFLLLCTRSLSLCPISDWIRLISLPNNLGIVFLHPCCHSYLNDNFSHLDYFYSLPAHLPAFRLLLPFICSQLGSPSDLHARHIWSIPSSTDNISMALCCSQDNDQIPQMS